MSVGIPQATDSTIAGSCADSEQTKREPTVLTNPGTLQADQTALIAGGEGIKRGPPSPLESPRVRMPPRPDADPSTQFGESSQLGAVAGQAQE